MLSKCWLKSLTYISAVPYFSQMQTEVYLLTILFKEGAININPVLHGHTQELEPLCL